MLPSASTTCAETRLSMVSPYLRTMNPMPPPVVSPPIPTEGVSPVVNANPRGPAAATISADVAPACTLAIPDAGSTETRLKFEKSITTASSITVYWAMLWPPLRTESGKPISRAKSTVAATSSADATLTIAYGKAVHRHRHDLAGRIVFRMTGGENLANDPLAQQIDRLGDNGKTSSRTWFQIHLVLPLRSNRGDLHSHSRRMRSPFHPTCR